MPYALPGYFRKLMYIHVYIQIHVYIHTYSHDSSATIEMYLRQILFLYTCRIKPTQGKRLILLYTISFCIYLDQRYMSGSEAKKKTRFVIMCTLVIKSQITSEKKSMVYL
jgi:hypothetical protein